MCSRTLYDKMAFGLADTRFPVHDTFELSQEIVEIFNNNGWWKK